MQEQERIASEWMRRKIISGLAIGLGLALILALLAGWQWREAETQRQVAEVQHRAALSRQLAAQAIPLSSQGLLDRALLLSQEALRASETIEARSALLTALQYSPRLTTLLKGHDGPVTSMAFSPNSKILASGGDDGSVILWDPQSRQQIGEPLRGHDVLADVGVSSVAFSPNGKVLASGSGDGNVILWDLQTRQQIGESLRGHNNWVKSVAFSPDGRMLTSGSSDNNVILWDPQTRQQIGEPLRGHDVLADVGVSSVAFSPNGKVLASGSGDNVIILWDVDIESWKERACRTANRNLTPSEWAQYLGNEPYHKTCSNVPEGR
jgi:WD40 repeat protein